MFFFVLYSTVSLIYGALAFEELKALKTRKTVVKRRLTTEELREIDAILNPGAPARVGKSILHADKPEGLTKGVPPCDFE